MCSQPELRFGEQDLSPVRFYAVFTDWHGPRLSPWWVHWFTRPNFRHVFVLLPTKIGTLVVNPLGNAIKVSWEPFPVEKCADACRAAGMAVAYGDTEIDLCYKWRGIITCVSVVKSLIGMNDWRVITPWQLYGRLNK